MAKKKKNNAQPQEVEPQEVETQEVETQEVEPPEPPNLADFSDSELWVIAKEQNPELKDGDRVRFDVTLEESLCPIAPAVDAEAGELPQLKHPDWWKGKPCPKCEAN